MLPDLDRLIRLQRLDNAAVAARRAMDAIPGRLAQLESRLTTSEDAVARARQRLDEAKTARLAVEKSLAEVQSRLSRYKDQLMAVKTNKEYTAMQHEIATAEAEVRRFEDRILEQMLAADDLTAEVAAAERALETDRAEVDLARGEIEAERTEMERRIDASATERATLSERISDPALRLFETIARQRGGVAVVEARAGHCTVCNVRLRPQIFNQVLRNDELIQCDSCKRLLYHEPAGGLAAGGDTATG